MAYLIRFSTTFKSDKYADQWLATLENHVFKVMGHKPISSITSADISCTRTYLGRKNDTAKKLKQRLSYIMKWAEAQAYYTGDNPVELAEQTLSRLKASGVILQPPHLRCTRLLQNYTLLRFKHQLNYHFNS